MNSKLPATNILSGIRSILAGGQPIPDAKVVENQLNLKTVIDHLEQIVCVKNERGIYVLVNDTFCKLLRLQESDILGKDDYELGFFLNPELVVQTDTEVFITKERKYSPAENITDYFGIKFQFQTDRIPIKDKSGAYNYLLFIARDVTNERATEQRLQKSKLRYKSIFDNNYSGIIVVSKDLKILNKNKAFIKLVSKKYQQYGNDSLKSYISEEDFLELRDLIGGIATRNYEYFDMELKLKATDHSSIETICFVRGLYDDNGQFTEAVITFQDITEQVKSRQALKQSENRFRVIVENAAESLLLFDYDANRYVDANKSAERLFGYTKNEFLRLGANALSPAKQLSGQNSKSLNESYMKLALNGEEVNYEWIVLSKDNKLIPCEVSLVKLPFAKSKIVRYSIIDISERKKNNELLTTEKQKLEKSNDQLRRLNTQLENQANQLKEFAYISSHNLRSPAGNIRALLDFYKDDPTKENFEFLLAKLDIVSEDLLSTINDLALVVQTKNEASAETSTIELSRLFEKAQSNLSQVIKDKKGTVEVKLNGINKILTSKTYLDSIVLNLMSNALKYSKEDIPPNIKVTAKELDSNFVLEVEDNGVGIDLKRFGSKIFGLRKTFHKNKDARGVGLFITKAQIESLGGSISVRSEVGVGSTFTVSLPSEIIER